MIALVCGAAVALLGAATWIAGPWVVKRLVRARLGGYIRDANRVDATRPEQLTPARRVAVVGGGIAGLTAALTLARRGFGVTLLEANAHLGGKLGSWPVDLAPGERAWVSHGFHAFFGHYHNLNRLLDSLALRRDFRSVGDYVILDRDGGVLRFGGAENTPILNLLALVRSGMFRLRDALAAPGRDLYGVLLEYEHDATVAQYDHLSFRDYCELAQVPPRLRLAFNTFARVFFADEDRLSLGELLKSFHFYYLGHDGGLVYQFPSRDYEASLLAPLRAELQRLGVNIRCSNPVRGLVARDGSFEVDGAPFDAVVLSADVVGVRSIMGAAQGFPSALTERFSKLRPGQRYAVLRVWTDRDMRPDLPAFVITDRIKVLDAVAAYHRIEAESAAWVAEHGGAVLEVHSYAVPDAMTDEEVKPALLDELTHFLPELRGMLVRHESFQLSANFTAFHVGMHADRPTVETGVAGLVCAGDWVKLPFPAMLLEAACASGISAANALFREAGLREERLVSVPLRGLLAGAPQPPGRKALLRRASRRPG